MAEGDSGYEGGDHAASCGSESDDSSDRSSVFLGRCDTSEAVDEQVELRVGQNPSAALTSARGTINSLRQLSLTLRLASAQHRSQRIQRFRTHNTYAQVFGVFQQYALQRAKYLFPLAPAFLVDRIAESIASRRIRFLYLERHQMKISTMNQSAPALSPRQQQHAATDKPAVECLGQSEPRRDLLQSGIQPSIIMSTTEITKIQPKDLRGAAQIKPERPESVYSIQISHGEFPQMPKLDEGGLSFTCPYCLLVCPIREVGHSNHDELIAERDASVEGGQEIGRLRKDHWR